VLGESLDTSTTTSPLSLLSLCLRRFSPLPHDPGSVPRVGFSASLSARRAPHGPRPLTAPSVLVPQVWSIRAPDAGVLLCYARPPSMGRAAAHGPAMGARKQMGAHPHEMSAGGSGTQKDLVESGEIGGQFMEGRLGCG
jgi:hypothetical protein